MGNNELSQALDLVINVIILGVIIAVVAVTAYMGIQMKDEMSDKVDMTLNVNTTAYEDIESMLIYEQEIPMATIFKVVQSNEGLINQVSAHIIDRATLDLSSNLPHSYMPSINLTSNDYGNKFHMKFVVNGTKLSDGTYTLELWEVL